MLGLGDELRMCSFSLRSCAVCLSTGGGFAERGLSGGARGGRPV